MCVSEPVVVHLKLEDSINIRQLELDTIFSTYKEKKTDVKWLHNSIETVCKHKDP